VDAFLNWLWQGCAIAVASGIMMRVARRASAATRYALWWLALVLVLLLPALRAGATYESGFVPQAGTELEGPTVTRSSYILPATPLVRLPIQASWSALLVAMWMAWAVVSLVRFAGALRGLSLARRACVPFPPDPERRLPLWAELRTRGRRARLVTCSRVRWAGVVGVRAPVIAVAPDLRLVLQDRELDQVIAHEWVHVQRRDDLMVLLQALVGAFAGFHPAVWWIGRRLDVERELACDELTVRVTGSVKDYARCLTKLATLPPSASVLRLAPAARSSARLSTRIVALLESKGYPARSQSLMAFSVTAATLLWLAPLAAGVALVATEERGMVRPTDQVDTERAPIPSSSLRATVTGSSKPQSVRPKERVERTVRSSRLGESREGRGRSVVPVASRSTPSAAEITSMHESVSRDEVPTPGLTVDTPIEAALTTLPGRAIAPASSFPPVPPTVPTPWRAAASSGVAVGRGSQKAAVATAGFFNTLGRKIADSF
jgi:beta-lactamase regulating signal transducer with metallopeptidase domain